MADNDLYLLAHHLPEPVLLEKLAGSLEQYRKIRSEQNKRELEIVCMMFIAKQITTEKGIDKILNQKEQVTRIYDRLNSQGN